jgi:hypothetical protein
MGGKPMRLITVIPAVVALFVSGAAYAQGWSEYVNRENFFTVNFPDDPKETMVPYKTVKGTDLTAHVFVATAPADSILGGKYTVTVVDYTNVKNELGDAMEQARQAILAKGKAKYDEINNLDMHRGRAMTVETANSRIFAEIILAANNRVYITEAENALTSPPPANFQASIQILDENGVRIRTRTVIAAPENEAAPIGAAANAAEQAKIVAGVTGTWRVAGGSCEAAYFKSGEITKTVRGEQAMNGTVVNQGVTITGQLILTGAREGQLVDTKTDKVIFIFEPQPDNKLSFSALGPPALGWPDAALELCPAAKG